MEVDADSKLMRKQLITCEEPTWTFNITELEVNRVEVCGKVKSAVSDATGVPFSDLSARLINQHGFGPTFVTVVKVR